MDTVWYLWGAVLREREREREREEVSFEERQIGSKEINALDLPLPLHSNTLSINST
jgi:hypothetical protein